jgi:HTH-type transcriptional regulator/antitoxin HigA
MQASTETFDVSSIAASWAAFDRLAHLRPIRSEAEYGRMVSLMNTLLDTVGDDEQHPLAGLLDLVGDLVGDYDQQHFTIEAAEPREVLRALMQAKDLSQNDLAKLVPQSNLSAILAGKRNISAALAVKLARYFNVNVALFVAT